MSVQVEKLEKNMAKLTVEVSAEDFEKVAETALRDGANLVNPKYVDREVILSILHKAY